MFYRVIFRLAGRRCYGYVSQPRGLRLLFKNAGNFSQYKRLLRSNWEINSITSSYTQINYIANHNYNKILKSDWLSSALISALIGQFNWTVRIMPK